jgi:hypothetical protein
MLVLEEQFQSILEVVLVMVVEVVMVVTKYF